MLNRLNFSIDIKADKTVIWKALWDDHAYRDWVSVFSEGSYVITDDWKAHSKVQFLGPDKSGIYSVIETHMPNKVMKFKHLGTVVNGQEQPMDEDTKKWTGATEMYTLYEGQETNKLTVEIDVLDEHLDFMKSTFPIALERIKNNCSNKRE